MTMRRNPLSTASFPMKLTKDIRIRRVRVNNQGYTSDGTYYGSGAPLYEVEDDNSGTTLMLRAAGPSEARALLSNPPNASPFYWEIRSFWDKVDKARHPEQYVTRYGYEANPVRRHHHYDKRKILTGAAIVAGVGTALYLIAKA
jgi:hypothetical protein